MDNQNNKKNDNNNRQNYGIIIITTIIAAVFVMFLYQLMQDTPSQEISYTKFMDMVEQGEVGKSLLTRKRLRSYRKRKRKSSRIPSREAVTDRIHSLRAVTGLHSLIPDLR